MFPQIAHNVRGFAKVGKLYSVVRLATIDRLAEAKLLKSNRIPIADGRYSSAQLLQSQCCTQFYFSCEISLIILTALIVLTTHTSAKCSLASSL
jgi:hypothetical protein